MCYRKKNYSNMTFQCETCEVIFKCKHHLQRHSAKKKPCIKKEHIPDVIEEKEEIIITRTPLEIEIDHVAIRDEYIKKISKYYDNQVRELFKNKFIMRFHDIVAKRKLAIRREKAYEIKKAMSLKKIPTEYIPPVKENKIQKINDKVSIDKLIETSLKLNDEINEISYKQFHLPETDKVYTSSVVLREKRQILFNIKGSLKLSGVDVKSINYKKLEL